MRHVRSSLTRDRTRALCTGSMGVLSTGLPRKSRFFLICLREMEEVKDGRPAVRNAALGFIDSGGWLVNHQGMIEGVLFAGPCARSWVSVRHVPDPHG